MSLPLTARWEYYAKLGTEEGSEEAKLMDVLSEVTLWLGCLFYDSAETGSSRESKRLGKKAESSRVIWKCKHFVLHCMHYRSLALDSESKPSRLHIAAD